VAPGALAVAAAMQKKEGAARGGCCRPGRLLSARCVLALLYVLTAAFALTAAARYYRIRTPGLSSVWKISKMFRPDYAAKEARKSARQLAKEAYKDTAIITLATGDAAAKHAIVLLKTLRDTGTQIPNMVVLLSRGGMGSEDCHNETLRNTRGRHYHCSSPLAQADDIVSQKYLDGFARLGASVRVIDPIADTPYTRLIPGGRATFWVSVPGWAGAGGSERESAHHTLTRRHLAAPLPPLPRAGHVLQQAAHLQHDGVP
jgi:hypothetical protein